MSSLLLQPKDVLSLSEELQCLSLFEALQYLSLSEELHCIVAGAAKTGTLASASHPLEGQAAGGAPTVRAGVVRTAAEASAGTLSGMTLSSQGGRAGVSNFPTRLEFYDTARGETFNAPFNTRAAGIEGYVSRVSSGSTVGAGRPGVQSHAPLSRYSPSAEHSRTTSHLQHNSPAGNPISSHGLQAGPGPAVADVHRHRLPTHSGSVAMDVHRHSLQTDPGPAVAVDVHGSHGPWRGATQVTVATQEPAAAGRAHKATDGATGSRQADAGQTPHSAGNFISIYIYLFINRFGPAVKRWGEKI